MQRGKIKRLTDKGFGFIAAEGYEKDLFFHASSLEQAGIAFNDLREGEMVEFEVAETPKGLSAVNVNRVTDNAPMPGRASGMNAHHVSDN